MHMRNFFQKLKKREEDVKKIEGAMKKTGEEHAQEQKKMKDLEHQVVAQRRKILRVSLYFLRKKCSIFIFYVGKIAVGVGY